MGSECDLTNVIFNLILLIGIFRPSYVNALGYISWDLTELMISQQWGMYFHGADRQQDITRVNVGPDLCRRIQMTTKFHYGDVIMSVIASQITSLAIVYSSVYSGADQRKRQRSASLALVWGIHRRPVNSPHKGPVTRKMFPLDDVIMMDVDKRH